MLYAHYIGVRRANFQKFSSRKTTGVKNTAVLARNSKFTSADTDQNVTARYFEKHSNIDSLHVFTIAKSLQAIIGRGNHGIYENENKIKSIR
jgi:hypothetical protein